MNRHRLSCMLLASLGLLLACSLRAESLPFDLVFKGRGRYDQIVSQAAKNAPAIAALPIGERVAYFGKMLVGTPYKGYTLEVHNRIEAPVVNLVGLDCWTFFETALAFARMAERPPAEWSPQLLREYIERDRYWGGRCDGTYTSRLHYLEDWAKDNDRRGLVDDLTGELGGIRVKNAAIEMTRNWRHYPYMAASAKVRADITKLEERLRSRPLVMIPKSRVPAIVSRLKTGDIISIVTKDGAAYGTSHVGLAIRQNGVLRFMHASAPRNAGKVIIDQSLPAYLNKFSSTAGIMVARPLK
ncbi:MAG TPA: N-acetylmuramoyl-L-alanine amidase-like domain-containing protein [Prosthecobacter sp.]|nr:N-acetylmuramoyl-L-alanine amidase-like domain-containing protein [Prosthecobacter sp.]